MGRSRKRSISGFGLVILLAVILTIYRVNSISWQTVLLWLGSIVIVSFLIWLVRRALTRKKGQPDLPPSEASRADLCWIPAGQHTTVQGIEIPGLVYVGRHLSSITTGLTNEPALIDPQLPVTASESDPSSTEMPSTISYTLFSPAERAAYLNWLAAGRTDPTVDRRYVRLFFYGLERRLLYDEMGQYEESKDRHSTIQAAEELLLIYGDDPDFARAAERFIRYARYLTATAKATPLPPDIDQLVEDPDYLKLALGEQVAQVNGISARWALAWVYCTTDIGLREAAMRCSDKLERLFQLRFHRVYGEAAPVELPLPSLRIAYTPVSPTFEGRFSILVSRLGDVTRQYKLLREFTDLAGTCADALEPFCKWQAEHPEENRTPDSQILPWELTASNK